MTWAGVGMTWVGAGMVLEGAGMVLEGAGMTWEGVGMTWEGAVARACAHEFPLWFVGLCRIVSISVDGELGHCRL